MQYGKKMMLLGIGAIATAGVLMSFANGDEEKKKRYQIIHQKDGEIVEYDTLIPSNSSYTPEDFLADKGIDASEAQIIEVPSFEHQMVFLSDLEDHHEMMDEHHRMMIKHHSDIDFTHEGEEGEQVEIKVELDDEGNMTMRKWVNGEEVEVTEEDKKQFHMNHTDGHEFMRIEVDGDDLEFHEEDVQIKVEMDDEGNVTMRKWVNGEEVELTEEEMEKIKHHHDHNQMIVIEEMHDGSPVEHEEVRIMVEVDDEGNKTIKKWVNGEEVEISEEELDAIEMEHDEHRMIIKMDAEGASEEELQIIMKEFHGDMEDVDIEIEELIEEIHEEIDGEMIIKRQFISEEEEMNWSEVHDAHVKIMHEGDEDFTIVIVSEEGAHPHMMHQRIVKEHPVSPNGIVVYPNPTDGVFTISFNQEEAVKTNIEITDIQGKVVFKEKLGKFSGEYRKEIDLKKEGKGVYLVNVQRGDDVASEKVIVD